MEGEPVGLSKGGTFMAQHLLVPREGVAVHINAYNFPIWGMLEKIAVNLLAGMPAVVKPAVPSAYLTEAVVREIIASGILPEGALQLVVGSGQGLLDHVTYQDVVTFTGSAATGRKLRAHPRIIEEAVPFTMEADSLNAAVLGPDARPGTPEFDLFVKEVRKEMTAKCGQKCTAIRRAIVPENLLEDVQIALGKLLAQTTVGHPQAEGVRMGALAGREQAETLARAGAAPGPEHAHRVRQPRRAGTAGQGPRRRLRQGRLHLAHRAAERRSPSSTSTATKSKPSGRW